MFRISFIYIFRSISEGQVAPITNNVKNMQQSKCGNLFQPSSAQNMKCCTLYFAWSRPIELELWLNLTQKLLENDFNLV